MSDMKWFRLYNEAVDDEKLRLLAFEDRWHFVAIMCCKSAGLLDRDDPLLRRKLAVKLGLDIRTLEDVERRLQEVGLIGEDFQPIAWDKRQYESDSSAARVAAYRERKKQEAKSDVTKCNVTVTPTDTDTDTDTDIKPNNQNFDEVSADEVAVLEKPKKPTTPFQQILDTFHAKLPQLSQVYKLTEKRKTHIKSLWLDELDSINAWENYFEFISRSDFLMGRVSGQGGRHFQADFDFLINPNNFVKIAEEKYHGKKIQR